MQLKNFIKIAHKRNFDERNFDLSNPHDGKTIIFRSFLLGVMRGVNAMIRKYSQNIPIVFNAPGRYY